MNGTHLRGLEGTNPLGFFAALGVQAAFANKDEQPCLWWSDDVTPCAIVDQRFSVDRIADQALETCVTMKKSFAVNPARSDGSIMPKGDELKLRPDDIRVYLREAVQRGSGGHLATALIAEGSLDNNGVAKPTDFYFTAGQQKFLNTTRKILDAVVHKDFVADLASPWRYQRELPSLGWDVTDDRVYALRANNPSPERKLTNPGAEALAIMGLSLYPVFAGIGRTLAQGCSGSWKRGHYSWPLWTKPATPYAVKSLLTHASHHNPIEAKLDRWFRSWGISMVLRSSIRRSGQGGYGTFGPPGIIWQGN